MTQPSTRLDLSWLLIALLAVVSIAPLTFPGYFEAESGFLPAFKAQSPANVPGWAQVAPPLQAEASLPYLLIWPWLQLYGAVAAVKWGFGLAFLLAALGVYAWTRPILGAKGGVLGAVVYTYLPLHLSTVYVRGALAEAWLWAIWPWILWSAGLIGRKQRALRLTGLIAGLSLLAATFWLHSGLALLGLLVLVPYALTTVDGKIRQQWRIVCALPLLILLIWLFARTMPPSDVSFDQSFLHPAQILATTWADETQWQLGLAATGLTILGLALWPRKGRQAGEPVSARLTPAVWYWLTVLLALIFLSLPFTGWLWRLASFDRLVDQPWQVLALAGLPLAYLAGLVIRLEPRMGEPAAWAALVALVILSSYPLLSPSFTQIRPGSEPVAVFLDAATDTPQLLLLDAEVATGSQVAATVTVTLTWQALKPITEDYTAFLHLLSEDGSRLAQRDRRPCDGQCPTDSWQPGVIVTDTQTLPAPAGSDRLAVGLYLLGTGDRVPVAGRDDGTVFVNVH